MIDFIKSRIDEILQVLDFCSHVTLEAQKSNNMEIFKKKDETIVTEYDFAVEHIIVSKLKEIFGDIPVVSEEFEDEDNLKNIEQNLHFVLDPIDGTHSFAKGEEYSINLGVVLNKKCVLSFLVSPHQDNILFANENKVFLYSLKTKDTTEIKINQNIGKNYLNTCVSRTYFSKETITKNFLATLSENLNKEIIYHNFSGSVRYTIMIIQDFDVSVSLKGFKYWDIMPLLYLLESAGLLLFFDNKYTKNIDPALIFKNFSCNQDLIVIKKKLLNYVP